MGLLDGLQRYGEPALGLLSGAVAEPLAGWAGLLTGGNAQNVERARNMLTYQPRSAAGTAGQNALANALLGIKTTMVDQNPPVRMAVDGYNALADKMGMYNPALGAAAKTLPAAAMAFAGPGASQVRGAFGNVAKDMYANAGAVPAMRGPLSHQGGAINFRIGDVGFDQRFDPRVNMQERLNNLTTTIDDRVMQPSPTVHLPDYEGYPFLTSMADRTSAGGHLSNINGVDLKKPVHLQGGQNFMFDNNDGVWASAHQPVKQLMDMSSAIKGATGKDPLYFPWRMSPTGGDFSSMTGNTMLSYAESALPKAQRAKVDSKIRQLIPGWEGLDSPNSQTLFASATKSQRDAVMNMMDVNFRDRGLGIGEARLAVTDPSQLLGGDGGLLNVGQIFSDQPITKSRHVDYPSLLPGRGVGKVGGQHNVFELLPKTVRDRAIPDPTSPRITDLRALMMKPYAGIIDNDLLKSLGY
jgi:hypothetical protein